MDLVRLDYTWYTPNFRGNRMAAHGSRMRVELKPPAYGVVLRRPSMKDPLELGERQRRIFVAGVRAIEGLTLDGTPITTAEALWRAAVVEESIHYELILEVLTAIDDLATLEAGLGNGSGSPPGSSS